MKNISLTSLAEWSPMATEIKRDEFLGTWEMIHNPNFKVIEFDHFKMQANLPSS